MVAKASTQEGRDKSFAVLNEIIAFAESKGVGHIAIVIGIDDGPDDGRIFGSNRTSEQLLDCIRRRGFLRKSTGSQPALDLSNGVTTTELPFEGLQIVLAAKAVQQ